MVINSQTLHSMTVGFNVLFNKAFQEATPNYLRYATVVPSSNGSEDYGWLGQLPSMREWIGEREIQNIEAYDYTIKNTEYEVTVAIKRSKIEDDAYGIYNPIITSLGKTAATHPDKLCADLLKDGFTNKCYDKKPFFSETHKIGSDEKALVVSNCSNEKLGFASYGKARTAIMSMQGEKGRSLNLVPDLLVVSPKNEETARKILKADLINGGDSNIYKDTAELLVDPQLSNKPDMWFLLCTTQAVKPIIFQKRKEIKFTALNNDTDANVFMKNEYLYGCDGRHNAGYGFWQMAYGSTGTKPEVPPADAT